MKIGTKSVLFGAHQFAIHPWFVAWAWWKLYGWPDRWQYWVAFFVHDLGYWGLPNMDGKEGEKHVKWGARFLGFRLGAGEEWYCFCELHSRYYAKKYRVKPSKLCYADKLAFVLTPKWVYIPLVWMTGEWKEYATAHRHETGVRVDAGLVSWYDFTKRYIRSWVEAHKYGEKDTWTIAKPVATATATAPGSVQGGRDQVE